MSYNFHTMAGKRLSLLIHFIWSTAGREPWIGSDWQDDLFGTVCGIMRKKKCPPDLRRRHVRSRSSICLFAFDNFDRRFRQRCEIEFVAMGARVICHPQRLLMAGGLWCIQRQHHAKRTFKDEYLEFLIQNEIEYDEKYLWD